MSTFLEYIQYILFVLLNLFITGWCVIKFIRFKHEKELSFIKPSKDILQVCFYMLAPFISFTVLSVSASGLLQLIYKHVDGINVNYYMYIWLTNIAVLSVSEVIMGIWGIVNGFRIKSLMLIMVSIVSILGVLENTSIRMLAFLGVFIYVMMKVFERKHSSKDNS